MAILLGMAAGAIFAIAPAAFAYTYMYDGTTNGALLEPQGPDAVYVPGINTAGRVSWSIVEQIERNDIIISNFLWQNDASHYYHSKYSSVIDFVRWVSEKQLIDARQAHGEQSSEENGYWILLSTLVFLLVFLLLISFGKFLQSLPTEGTG